MVNATFIKWFDKIRIEDVATVGGKNASIGEMYRELSLKGVKVPNGFAISADAYRYFLRVNGLEKKIHDELDGLNTDDTPDLQERGNRIRSMIHEGVLPEELGAEIADAYRKLGSFLGQPLEVAVRSSATAEDLPSASFAGQQESYLNIQGEDSLLDACKRCFASLFTDRAISYRHDQGFDPFSVALSIGVQRMVRSDLATSGVMFTLDTETGFRDVVFINAAYGLGENIVQGAVNPDEFYVFKPTLHGGFRPIIRKTLGTKEQKLVYDIRSGKRVKNLPVPSTDRLRFSLDEDEVLALARAACTIEQHYTQKNGKPSPMDIEWAKDGLTGEIYILQARPETVHSLKPVLRNTYESYSLKERGKELIRGRSVGEKIAVGTVRVIHDVKDLASLQLGEILVADKTDPDWEPAMKRAAAIVTNRGGRTCHAAIVSRELGIPAVIGTEKGTDLLRDGQMITVSCAEGETGRVYEGKLPFSLESIDFKNTTRPKTKIMMNLGDPDEAFRFSFIPNDGVGLARMEFIISNAIQVHPLALVNFDVLKDRDALKRIEQLTYGYKDKSGYFIDRLAEGVGMIAAAFYPKDVIVRMSDFKTNEYANLIGGKEFEPQEENPMLGFRGASRYTHPRYREGFALECRAMKKVRDEMGLVNMKLMIPFCRTVEEGEGVIAEMEKHGLKRGTNGLEIYVMCEIPSNVILAEKFSKIFDGFSIGSNDLTQLVLGVDRASEVVAPIFDERNEAVKIMISQVIRVAQEHRRKIGICGQAPSDYPDFSEFLVEEGIDSISLNPDAVMKSTQTILRAEEDIINRGKRIAS